MPKRKQVPAKYLCSITGQAMIDPVIAAHGHTYEREAIEQLQSTVPQPFAQRPSLLTFLYSNLSSIFPKPLIGLIQEYYVAPTEAAEFLKLVAEGEQDQAEVMLKRNPDLALIPSDVKDLSCRSFNNITGFQYAVWALDWHMWTMIRKYLPDEEARVQAQGFETGSWVKSHGVHANLNILIQAYQTTSDLYGKKKWDEGNTAWVRQVGGAQLLLPAHVINEYCHPTRPFYPLPNFKDAAALPRGRTIDEGEWFTASYLGGKLGEKFAVHRGVRLRGTRARRGAGGGAGVYGEWVCP